MGEAKETKKREEGEKKLNLGSKRHALLVTVISFSKPVSQTQRRGESPDGGDRAMHLQVLSTHTFSREEPGRGEGISSSCCLNP